MSYTKKPLNGFERLPNAPLAEVVFELRWALQGDENVPAPLRVDPGFLGLLDGFTSGARTLGFPVHREVAKLHETAGWSVYRRFYAREDQNFPLVQIGPGIFAANQSAEYEWKSFKRLALSALGKVVRAYPKNKLFPLKPVYLELRYIDVFDEELIGTVGFLEFTNHATSMELVLPPFFKQRRELGTLVGGRVLAAFPIRHRKDTNFHLDYGSGERETQKVIRLESKVVSTGSGVPQVGKSLNSSVGKWLDEAHALLSPFFKTFIKPPVLEKFM